MKLAMIPLTMLAMLIGIGSADENAAEQTAAPVPSAPPAAADSAKAGSAQGKPSRPSKSASSPLLAPKEHRLHPPQVRELLDQWLANGLVRAWEASDAQPAPDLSLTLNDAAWGGGDRASAALLELSELQIPNVFITFPMSKRTDGKTPQPVATLSIGPRVEWEAARSIVEAFARNGITTKVQRRPTLSLWFVSSSFSSPDNQEMMSVVEELGLKVHKEHPLQLRTEVLFPENAAAIYEPGKAAQLLKWLKVRKLVFDEVPGDERSPWRVTRLPVGEEQNNGLVKRTSTWSWEASTHTSPSLQPGISIVRALTVTEDWRGKAGAGGPAIAHTSFSVPVEPGKVAIVHAFPIFDGENDPMFAAVPAAHRKDNYIALLIIQNHAVEQSASELLTDADEPKLLVPDAGVPVRLFPAGPRFGNAFAADFQVPSRLVDVQSRVFELHNLPRPSKPDSSSADDAQKFSLQFKSAPWPDVLELISEKSGLTLELRSTPPGTLGLEDPSLYSPTEAIDRLNEQLVGKGYLLIPRERTLICLNFQKEPVTRDLVPSVSLDDLPARGQYELLSVTIPISDGDIKEVAKDLEQIKGPAGSVVPLVSENSIVVTDLGGNLRRIARMVHAVSLASNKRWLEVYQVKSADPREVAKSLDALLPGVVVNQDLDAKRIHIMGTANQHEEVRQQIAQLDSSAPSQLKVIRLQNAQAGPMSSLLAQVVRKEGFTAVADERTNSIVVTSPDEDTFLVAEALLAKLDEDTPDRGVADPYAGRASSGPTPAAKPLVELQQTHALAEESAAKQSRQLREFIAKRPVALRDKRFAEQQQQQRERLAKAVKEAFAARQAQLAAELAELQRRVEAAQRSLELRNRAADEIIARRVEDLLNPELNWDEPQVAGEMVPAARPTESSPLTLPAPPVMPGAARSPVDPSGPGTTRPPAVGSSTGLRKARTTIPLRGFSRGEAEELHSQIKETVPGTESSINFTADGSELLIDCTEGELAPLRPLIERAMQTTNDRWKQTELQLLTGIWESQDGLGGGMGMGMGGGGYGGSMAAMSGDPPPRLVIDGEYAALYVKNERRRLWTITVELSLKSWTRVAFLPLDDQPGMQGSFNAREKSLTVVSSGDEGAKVVRYDQSISAVPPDWSQQMRDAAREKAKATPADPLAATPNVPDEFAARPRIDLASLAPNGEADVLSKMTGLWANAGHRGGMGMGMGMVGSLGGGFDEMGRRSPTFLVIHSDRAALFEKNERKRLWSISVMQLSETEARLDFAALDDEPGMQGTYTLKSGSLSAVSSSEQGPRIVQYHRVAPVIPPEWAQVMSHPSREDVQRLFENREPEPQRSKTGEPSASQPVRRQPSDYLPLLEKYRAAQGEYDSLLQTVGADHPRARKFHLERSHELDAIEVLKSEFELDVDEAMRRRSLAREQAVQAEERFTYTRRQVEKGTASQTMMEQERLARDSARAELESAEKRLELFESSRAKLFPRRGDFGALPIYAPPATGAAPPPGPAAPPDAPEIQIPSPATQPSIGEKPSEPNPPPEPPQTAAPPATP